jgi:hypothetical protein
MCMLMPQRLTGSRGNIRGKSVAMSNRAIALCASAIQRHERSVIRAIPKNFRAGTTDDSKAVIAEVNLLRFLLRLIK